MSLSDAQQAVVDRMTKAITSKTLGALGDAMEGDKTGALGELSDAGLALFVHSLEMAVVSAVEAEITITHQGDSTGALKV